MKAKSALNKLKKRDSWYGCLYTLNPYRGCEHACTYCYVAAEKWRGSYHALPEELSYKVVVKENLPNLLAEEVKHLLADVVFIGSSCDPYQPCEEKYEITRKCLEILLRNNWPIEIGTKSKLILRDLDLLKRFKETSFCCVFVTITCLDEKLSKLLEPNVPSPLERLSVIKQLSDEGVETCVCMIPIMPCITDAYNEVKALAEKAKEFNAKYFLVGELTLPGECRKIFYKFLEQNYPSLIPKYNKLYGPNGYVSDPSYRHAVRKLGEQVCRELGLKSVVEVKYRGKKLADFL